MPRRTFFSFHYKPDIWRAQNVRNCWVVKPQEEIDLGFYDSSVFEAKQKENDATIKAFLREGVENTSVTCVLVGKDTWTRRWVRYEIARSVVKGNGILSVYIHGIKNSDGKVSSKGVNPLDAMGVYKTDSGIFLAEWKEGKWVKYDDYTLSIPAKFIWFSAPTDTNVVSLSSHCFSYDFTAQNGRKNIGGWIETAAGLAGH